MMRGLPTDNPGRLYASLPPIDLHRLGAPVARPNFHNPETLEALAYFRSPRMPSDVRFALVRQPENTRSKPVAMATMASLARAIHFDRQGQAIVLADYAMKVQGWDGDVPGVSIWTLTEGGDAHRFIGWAWLDGGDRHVLQRALDSQVSTAPTIGAGRAA